MKKFPKFARPKNEISKKNTTIIKIIRKQPLANIGAGEV